MSQSRGRNRGIVFACGMGLVGAVLLGIMGPAVSSAMAQDNDGAGLVVGKANAEDVGLPIYPGSKPYKDPGNDSYSDRLGAWGGGYGFKLAVVSMQSNDAPAQVAGFYKKALAKYGNVLDCSRNVTEDKRNSGSSSALSCGNDRSDPGGMLFKSGTKKKQHMVALKPNGKGTVFHLIYLWVNAD